MAKLKMLGKYHDLENPLYRYRLFYRRMKYLWWVEWNRIVRNDRSIPVPGIYLVSQRNLTEEEYAYGATLEPLVQKYLTQDSDPADTKEGVEK